MEHEEEARGFKPLWVVAVAALVVIGMLGAVTVLNSRGNDASATTEPSRPESEPAEAPTEEEDERECPSSWILTPSDKEDNRWFAAGLQEIEEASTPEQAREAANTWLSQVRRDPQLLVGAARYFLDDREVKSATFVDADDKKCASEVAVIMTAEIELVIAASKVESEEAPSDGTNSGTNGDGDVVASETPGITGNRAAIKITTPDGKEIWILSRCGNPVVKGPAPVPPGPTDEPPPEKPKGPKPAPPAEPKPEPEPEPEPEPGKGPERDPAEQGNVPAPIQGKAPPVTGPATPPAAGKPPTEYETPPPPPPAPPTTQPGPPVTAPPTTAPPATTPPTTAPPTTELPAPR